VRCAPGAPISVLQAGGLLGGSDAFFNTRIERLAALALRGKVPTVYQFREFVAAGGLMRYGSSATEFQISSTANGSLHLTLGPPLYLGLFAMVTHNKVATGIFGAITVFT
jgi:hypothetical protein